MDHLNVVRHYAGEAGVNVVIANSNVAQPDGPDGLNLIPPKAAWDDDTMYISADIIDEGRPTRHDAAKLASAISEAYQKHRGKRRRLPRLRRSVQPPPLAPGNSRRSEAR